MIARFFLAVSALLLVSTQASALCRDDLKEVKPRIDHMKTVNQTRYYVALKWWGRALEEQNGSESACVTYLTRAKKALFDPLPEVNNCYGPNAYLPQCQNGGMPAGGPAYAPPGFALGNGGGGGGGVAPVGPVTAGPAPSFTPPGGLGSSSVSPPR
jgi:hypothetical protein